MTALTVRRAAYALGAEITGLDASKPLPTGTLAELQRLWLEHLVIVLPGQPLEPEELIAFTEPFGELDDNRKIPHERHPLHPKVQLLSNQPQFVGGKKAGGHRGGIHWHSDLSYTNRPAKATLLLCKVRPDVGGDTMFTNMYAAYDALSPRMRELLEGLEGVHDATLIKGFKKRSPETMAEQRRLNPPIAHPVVRVHPDTGRKALYVSERVRQFAGMSEEESRPLLDFLTAHVAQPEFVYRHRWEVGDLVMWDNRCTMHVALGDYDTDTQTRIMLRTTTLGGRSGSLYGRTESAAIAPSQPMAGAIS